MNDTQEDAQLSPAAAELVSVFGVMNAGQVADLLEPPIPNGELKTAPLVEIDLPEPELKFSKSVGSEPDAVEAMDVKVDDEDLRADEDDTIVLDNFVDGAPDAVEAVEVQKDDQDLRSDEGSTIVLDNFVGGASDAVEAVEVQVDDEDLRSDEDGTIVPDGFVDGAPDVVEAAEVQKDDQDLRSDEDGTMVMAAVDDTEEPSDFELVTDIVGETADSNAPGIIASLQDASERPAEPLPEQLLRVEKLIMALREDGHLAASIDPLGLRARRTDHLLPSRYGIDDATLDVEASWLARSEDDTYMWLTGPTVRDSIETLRGLYCGNVGYEFEHVHNVDERSWLQAQVESQSSVSLMSDDQRRNVLELLSKAEGFERYLHSTFPGKRWYSLEGLDALMVLIDQIVLQSAFEVRQIVIGMTHRGRLNVLAHILDQPYDDVLSGFLEGRFAHLSALEASGWMTDVKYHLGSRTGLDVNDDGTTDIVLRLLPNPSHLEMVTPAVLGAVRAIQDGSRDDQDPQLAAMALLVHGDAAFAGQGIVSEALNLMNLRGYSVGGAVHVIANNQIGFTTEVDDAFSGSYASDVARGYEIPVVHVNADDISACATVAKMAVSYRSRFRKDFVIDLVGYRRHGHNENDDPSITQPTMYKAVETQPTVREKWSRQLIDDEVVTSDAAAEMLDKTAKHMDAVRTEIEASGRVEHHEVPAGLGLEQEGISGIDYGETAVESDILRNVNDKLVATPDGFELHPTVQRVYERRAAAFDDGAPPIDWSHAELLSFGSLLNEGIDIRLTGQDVARGTFSQRHAALFDVRTSEPHIPLDSISEAAFRIYNSPLSEAGPLGFEHGYSVQSGSTLVLWEAQFGDFVNNAQSVIDEIVVSADEKWGQTSSLVLLLPHGYEGQGPNHSHAHLERFLELSARGNVRIAFPTTAAQYFHLLRTQAASLVSGDGRRPLVIMSPKSLLRHPLAASRVSEFTNGKFRSVRRFMLGASRASDVTRVVLCTGKVFVDVASHPAVSSVESVGVVVLEELYPFPGRQLEDAMASFPNANTLVWLQEEPMNRGAWDYVRSPLVSVVQNRIRYVGRPRSPSPASGSNWLHRLQQDALLKTALGLEDAEVAGTR